MIQSCIDYCELKAFRLTEIELESLKELKTPKGVVLKVSTQNLDTEIIIVNKSANEVDFKVVLDKVLLIISDKMYSDNGDTLAACVVREATKKSITLSIAESLTGGMLCSSIVDVAGSSKVLNEGFVTYSNEAKVRRLHVKLKTLEDKGAVSEETAREMVNGLLENKDISLAISTTGCAGPGSDEKNTPVGTAYIGYGDRNDIKVVKVDIDGDRTTIRKTVTNLALYIALIFIRNK